MQTKTMLKELITKTRTCRRFYEDVELSMEFLEELIDLARLGGSARNAQPLKYMPVHDRRKNAAIFPHLGWAGYLRDWPGPDEGERPAAYIICLNDTRIDGDPGFDLGIASQNILLAAAVQGVAGCRIGSISPKLRDVLDLPDHLRIILVLALGKPKEPVVLEEMAGDGDVRYWRDATGIHHVPKRSLGEIIVR